VDDHGRLAAEPLAVLDRKLGKGLCAAIYVLILWSHSPKEDATWDLYSDMEKRSHHFNLEA